MATPHHNINAIHTAFGYQQRVPEDVPPFSSPVLAGGTYWLYTFEEEGVYDYVCSPHEAFGMAGRIVAGSATGPGAEPIDMESEDEQARPPTLTAALVLSDEALDPERIVEEGSVSWDGVADESKQLLIEIRGGEEPVSHNSHE
ncbi:plastocyanin/azurin family copper-binding protein [Halalkalicoccus sp. NIPERK01]|uniref:cupredoxin domain-containing protein n=1 Tax=Halalkalicoccus sp. NIPERK01 TaxID=3053469 RepID=UPI00256EB3AA|nr:plastocyanin/azurin family copper-binding protein [Halalkalicoccus sp. NIPERK01]MDL5363135.1 plastocyanin/azurin family copper-binding protein [Halalkalicoccus sp. NIPERK01]